MNLGRLTEARAAFGAALELALRAGLMANATTIRVNLLNLGLDEGAFEDVRARGEKLVAHCDREGLAVDAYYARLALAEAQAALGNYGAVRDLVEILRGEAPPEVRDDPDATALLGRLDAGDRTRWPTGSGASATTSPAGTGSRPSVGPERSPSPQPIGVLRTVSPPSSVVGSSVVSVAVVGSVVVPSPGTGSTPVKKQEDQDQCGHGPSWPAAFAGCVSNSSSLPLYEERFPLSTGPWSKIYFATRSSAPPSTPHR